jgi:hypothetical protein
MKALTLRRFDRTGRYIIGNLANERGDFDIFTLERPWLDNKKMESCIPTGMYVCKHYESEKYPDNWEIQGVPNRDKILIHSANYVRQINGCIATGTKVAELGDEKIMVDSKIALKKLKLYIGRDDKDRLNTFLLNIVDV